MKFESFTYTVDEYAGVMTENTHSTLRYLHRHGYLTTDQLEDLSSRLIVTPIRNRKTFGQRVLSRFFAKDSEENLFVFPIVSLDPIVENEIDTPSSRRRPKLELVE